MNVTICRTPTRVSSRSPAGERWCFPCRARRLFDLVVETPDGPPSVYESTLSIVCAAGHLDGDLFPGRARTWDDEP